MQKNEEHLGSTNQGPDSRERERESVRTQKEDLGWQFGGRQDGARPDKQRSTSGVSLGRKIETDRSLGRFSYMKN